MPIVSAPRRKGGKYTPCVTMARLGRGNVIPGLRRPSGREPPVDQLAHFRVAEIMTSGIGSEAQGAESEAGERVGGLLHERHRSVPVLFSGRKPCGYSPRA